MGTREGKADHYQHTRTICKTYSLGVSTSRDEWVYDFNLSGLTEKTQQLIRNYNSEVYRWSQEGNTSTSIDDFVNNAQTFLKWTDRLKDALLKKQIQKFGADKVRNSLYRPFCKRFLYFDHLLNQRRYQQYLIFPTPQSEIENSAICLTDLGSEKPFMVLISNVIPDLHLVGAGASAQCFPYYIYDEDGNNQRENISDLALAQFQAQYGTYVTRRDIFHYLYAILHHPQYRERYAENLKRDLPYIPLLKDSSTFATCVRIGKQLMEFHLHYEQAPEYPLKWIENKDVYVNWRVEKMRLTPNKDAIVVNEWLTLTGIPQECSQYRLGNRSALEWVIDQYQVSTDARSGITSDPNQMDDERYIVRLVGQVVTVSVETVKLVEELAREVRQEDWLVETTDSIIIPNLAKSVE